MRVLSLFDGIACGYEALKRAGIKIDEYFASEIDENAIKIAKKNHEDIIEIGDVQKIRYSTPDWDNGGEYLMNENGIVGKGPFDLLIGGSPCQGFSRAGKGKNFQDERSGLFFEYVRILKEVKPKYFLLENVKMKKERQDKISEILGVEPIEINSSLVSAQNRKRLYRTNIPGIEQPEDKKIMLKDILQEIQDQPGIKTNLVEVVEGEMRIKQATKKGYIVAHEGDGIDINYQNSKTRRGRVIKGKSNTLTTQGSACVYDKVIRKLTPIECERLQTLPDNYTEGISENQRYKVLGNGRTVEVIAHIFKHLI